MFTLVWTWVNCDHENHAAPANSSATSRTVVKPRISMASASIAE